MTPPTSASTRSVVAPHELLPFRVLAVARGHVFVAQVGSTMEIIGIAANAEPAASGQAVDVVTDGEAVGVAGGAFEAGELLRVGLDGTLVAIEPGYEGAVVGRALAPAHGPDDLVPIRVALQLVAATFEQA